MQIRKPVAVILSVVVTLPAEANTLSIREVALGIPIGSIVEARLIGKERPNKLRGRMGMLDNEAFKLIVENSGVEHRSIAFSRVESLKLLKPVRVQPLRHGLTLEGTAQAMPTGALVEIRFAGRQTPNRLRGRMGEVRRQEFQVQVFQSGLIKVHTVRFAEVESVQPVDSLWLESTAAKVHRGIGMGVSIVLTGVLVMVIVLVIAAKTGHLGG
jgi:hypothetical protein